jgi:hypothetical protein
MKFDKLIIGKGSSLLLSYLHSQTKLLFWPIWICRFIKLVSMFLLRKLPSYLMTCGLICTMWIFLERVVIHPRIMWIQKWVWISNINLTYIIHVSCWIFEIAHNVYSTQFGQFHNELTLIENKINITRQRWTHKTHGNPKKLFSNSIHDTWQLDINQKLTLISWFAINPIQLSFLGIVVAHLVLVFSLFSHFKVNFNPKKMFWSKVMWRILLKNIFNEGHYK